MRKLFHQLVPFFLVMGPAVITLVADNDAGAVTTYTQAGLQYGPKLLWLFLPLIFICYTTQEMVCRLGIATGKGHAEMIYQRWGKGWGAFSLFELQLTNYLVLVTEFAAIAMASVALGFPPVCGVLLCAGILVLIVSLGGYKKWERYAIGLCVLDLAWIVYAVVAKPPTSSWLGFVPAIILETNWLWMVIGIAGTTCAAWQLYMQQSCVADKKLRFKDLKFERAETLLGACIVVGMAICMVLVGDWGRRVGLPVTTDISTLAMALGERSPLLGQGLLLLLINASVLGAMAISLSSAWAMGEVMGWKASLNCGWKDAPGFFGIYTAAILSAALLVLWPGLPLQFIIVAVQVLSGVLLPSAIIFLQLLLQDPRLGPYQNTMAQNIINWTIILALMGLSCLLALNVLLPTVLR